MKKFGIGLGILMATTAISFAQDITPTTPSNFLNIMLGVCAGLITTIFLPLAYLWGRLKIAEYELKLKQIQEQARGAVSALGQKAIGGEIGEDGQLTAGAVRRAADILARNAAESMVQLGVKEQDIDAKALEVINATVGLMNAQAAGNPVPNTSQTVPSPPTQNVTVSPAKK